MLPSLRRFRSGSLTRAFPVALVLVAAGFAACDLNPQPLPPIDNVSDKGTDAGDAGANALATPTAPEDASAGGNVPDADNPGTPPFDAGDAGDSGDDAGDSDDGGHS
jgi:hypothetical protein